MNPLGAQRSGAPEWTPFLKRSGREEPGPALGTGGEKRWPRGFHRRGDSHRSFTPKSRETGAVDTRKGPSLTATGCATKEGRRQLQGPLKTVSILATSIPRTATRAARSLRTSGGLGPRRRDGHRPELAKWGQRQGLCEPFARRARVRTSASSKPISASPLVSTTMASLLRIVIRLMIGNAPRAARGPFSRLLFCIGE